MNTMATARAAGMLGRLWPLLSASSGQFPAEGLPPLARSDSEIVLRVLAGDQESFSEIVKRYQPRVFGMARRYLRRESEVEDAAQEVFIKAYQKLSSYRAEAPFEHWLMRLAVRTCYDHLRAQRRNRESALSEVSPEEAAWVERCLTAEAPDAVSAQAVRELVRKLMSQLSPASQIVISLLEIEERSVREIASLTGWSVPLVKVRAFRARAEMRRLLGKLRIDQYL